MKESPTEAASCNYDYVLVKEINTNGIKGRQFPVPKCERSMLIGFFFDRPILQSKTASTKHPRPDVGSLQDRFVCYESRIQGDSTAYPIPLWAGF